MQYFSCCQTEPLH